MQYKKDWLIIANGEPLPQEEMLQWAENKSIMALDGAFTSALAECLLPQVVLGDLDSIDPALKEKFSQNNTIQFIQELDQNTTDLEKGLLYLAKQQPRTVTIINATGWRLDHTLYNLSLLKRFHAVFESLMLVTAREKIFYLKDQGVRLQAEGREPLALLGFTEAEVSSSGLLYELQQLRLQLGAQESISNALSDGSAALEIKGSLLLLISHSTNIQRFHFG